MDLLVSWNIGKKICSRTVDNTSTNDAMVRDLKHLLDGGGHLALCGDLFHVCCSAYVFNLVVQDGLHHIASLLSKIRECKICEINTANKS